MPFGRIFDGADPEPLGPLPGDGVPQREIPVIRQRQVRPARRGVHKYRSGKIEFWFSHNPSLAICTLPTEHIDRATFWVLDCTIQPYLEPGARYALGDGEHLGAIHPGVVELSTRFQKSRNPKVVSKARVGQKMDLIDPDLQMRGKDLLRVVGQNRAFSRALNRL